MDDFFECARGRSAELTTHSINILQRLFK